MKSITLKLDLYSKIILTVIAIALVGLFLRGLDINQEAIANPSEIEAYITNPEDIANAIVNQTLEVEVTNGYDLGYNLSLWLK